jgi:hypothetical protein
MMELFIVNRANAESSVPILPAKLRGVVAYSPHTRGFFQFAQEIRDLVGSSEAYKEMDVVFNASD